MDDNVQIAKTFLKDVAKQYGVDINMALTGLLNGFTANINGKDINISAIANKSSVDLLTIAHRELTNNTLF